MRSLRKNIMAVASPLWLLLGIPGALTFGFLGLYDIVAGTATKSPVLSALGFGGTTFGLLGYAVAFGVILIIIGILIFLFVAYRGSRD